MKINKIKERIIFSRLCLGYRQKDVAKETNYILKQYSISKQERGDAYPSLEYLDFLCVKGVNMNWLFTGKGKMFAIDNENDGENLMDLKSQLSSFENRFEKYRMKVDSLLQTEN